MKISDFPLIDGKFVRRINRFVATAVINRDGQMSEVQVHVANTGRMQELLIPGTRVRMAYNPSPKRKTDYTLLLVLHQSNWVCIHSTMANQLAWDYFKTQKGITQLRREVCYKNSRFDLGFEKDGKPYFFEVKSVNLVEGETALFPDAPTERGSKHLKELIQAMKKGYGTGVLFIVQRKDANYFKPHTMRDPRFSVLLKEAYDSGVIIKAFRCNVSETEMIIDKEIPVIL